VNSEAAEASCELLLMLEKQLTDPDFRKERERAAELRGGRFQEFGPDS